MRFPRQSRFRRCIERIFPCEFGFSWSHAGIFPESDEAWANYGVVLEVGRQNCFSDSDSAKKAWRCDQFQQPRVQLGIVKCYEFTSHISTNSPIDWSTGRSFCTAGTPEAVRKQLKRPIVQTLMTELGLYRDSDMSSPASPGTRAGEHLQDEGVRAGKWRIEPRRQDFACRDVRRQNAFLRRTAHTVLLRP